MLVVSTPASLRALFKDLQSLRGGVGLREPRRLLACSEAFHQVTGMSVDGLTDAQQIDVGMSSLIAAVDSLDKYQREIALTELNLNDSLDFPTLTERQGFLAEAHRCDPKTIRRHGNRALDAVAYFLTSPESRHSANSSPPRPATRLQQFEHLLWPVEAERVTIISGEIMPAGGGDSTIHRPFLLESQDSLAIIEASTNLVTVNKKAAVNVTSSSNVQAAELLDSLIVIGGPRSNSITNRLLSELPLQVQLITHGKGSDKEKYFHLPDGSQVGAQHMNGHLCRDIATLIVGPNPFNTSQRLLLVASLYSHGNWGAVMSVSRRRSNPVVDHNLELLSSQPSDPLAFIQLILEVPVVDDRVLPTLISRANVFITRLKLDG
ncbi:MAG: hypothetical protein ACRDT0_06125 [Pseudonocardiaceae bacterium]